MNYIARVKKEFASMNHKRCSFCTKYLSDFNAEMTVEHIETKRDCPEKIFQWDNLLCACHTCNTKRSTNKYSANIYLDPKNIFAFMQMGAYRRTRVCPMQKLRKQNI